MGVAQGDGGVESRVEQLHCLLILRGCCCCCGCCRGHFLIGAAMLPKYLSLALSPAPLLLRPAAFMTALWLRFATLRSAPTAANHTVTSDRGRRSRGAGTWSTWHYARSLATQQLDIEYFMALHLTFSISPASSSSSSSASSGGVSRSL